MRRDAELNRRRILRAGHEVFAARGLQATLNDVAHHAGLGVGTVYRKYPDKQALAAAVFAEELDGIAAMAREALAEDDGFAALAGFLEKALGRAADNRGLRELMRDGIIEGTGPWPERGRRSTRAASSWWRGPTPRERCATASPGPMSYPSPR
ncbi:TetR/AcrR family transcriptional regulator [Streptomyces sp. TE33382]